MVHTLKRTDLLHKKTLAETLQLIGFVGYAFFWVHFRGVIVFFFFPSFSFSDSHVRFIESCTNARV